MSVLPGPGDVTSRKGSPVLYIYNHLARQLTLISMDNSDYKFKVPVRPSDT